MENLYLLHDTYYKGDFYLSITINGMGDLKLCIYIYKYIEVKTFLIFLHHVNNLCQSSTATMEISERK